MQVEADRAAGAGEASAVSGVVVSLPVAGSPAPRVRPSRMSRRRAAVLIGVHLLIIAHVVHWLWAGRTISPIEPSEAMYTLNEGHLNAGFIFFALAIVATAVFGRFVCGWGCHVIAYQDLCNWLLKRIGIRPKPLRSRLLVWAPLALALYMFVWPTTYRWWVGVSPGPWTNHLMTADFWKTFPGPVVAVLTIIICGFAIVYFLGSKGFCTYACPYGGFFAMAEKVSPGRIRVSDACAHCGHCTSACTSNVRVHEEVARYGMVVDPGCMKCLDCVTVCPNDALYFGFGKPGVAAKSAAPVKSTPYDFGFGEELAMLVVGLVSLLTYRGLYDQIPLLMAMGMAGITALSFMKLVRLVRRANVRLQQLQLKRGGALTRSGMVFAAAVVGWFMLTAHGTVIRYHQWWGQQLLRSLALGDEIWSAESDWWEVADEEQRRQVEAGLVALQRADQWGWMVTPRVLGDLVQLQLAKGDDGSAEATARRLVKHWPDKGKAYSSLAVVLRKLGRVEEAIEAYRAALSHDPQLAAARSELASVLALRHRGAEAIAVYRAGLELSPDDPRWPIELGQHLIRGGRFADAREELERAIARQPTSASLYVPLATACFQLGDRSAGVAHLRRAIDLDLRLPEAHYNLGMALLKERQVEEAIASLSEAVELEPGRAIYHYNLGVATFMAGRPKDALRHIHEAIRLDADDADARAFLTMAMREARRLERGAEEAP